MEGREQEGKRKIGGNEGTYKEWRGKMIRWEGEMSERKEMQEGKEGSEDQRIVDPYPLHARTHAMP